MIGNIYKYKNNYGAIYILTNIINNLVYIGMTRNEVLKKRLYQHYRACYDKNKFNRPLYTDILKYKLKNFKIDILEQFEHIQTNDLRAKEKQYIQNYKKLNLCYNINN